MSYKVPESTKPFLWGATIGAIAISVVGFSAMGWMLGGTAERMAQARADAAVVTALTPICVENYMKQPDVSAQLATFKALQSWDQRATIEKGGWATGVNGKSPSSELLSACSAKVNAKDIPGKSAEAKPK